MLGDAVKLTRSKARFPNSPKQHATDPTTQPARKEIWNEREPYLAAKSGCAKTLSAHRLALQEFVSFAADERIADMDEITTAHMHEFYEELLDGGNSPFTAANKLLKVNSFYRASLGLDAGKGIIKKHVVETMFEGTNEAFAWPSIPPHSVCCFPILPTGR